MRVNMASSSLGVKIFYIKKRPVIDNIKVSQHPFNSNSLKGPDANLYKKLWSTTKVSWLHQTH